MPAPQSARQHAWRRRHFVGRDAELDLLAGLLAGAPRALPLLPRL